MGKLWKHLKTVGKHRKFVRKACFKMGLVWQGLTHDLSKYSIPELKMCKYWTGKGSPHQACREAIGYSPSWIHHYHKNKHHFQYWWDEDELGKLIPIKMPYKYMVESFCDMVGASKAYNPKGWTTSMVWTYWVTCCRGLRMMHPVSQKFVEQFLWLLSQNGEERFYAWYKKNRKWIKEAYEADDAIDAVLTAKGDYALPSPVCTSRAILIHSTDSNVGIFATSSFMSKIMERVAKAVDPELGKLYAKVNDAYVDGPESDKAKEWLASVNSLFEDETRFPDRDSDVYGFLFADPMEGMIGKDTCVKIMRLLSKDYECAYIGTTTIDGLPEFKRMLGDVARSDDPNAKVAWSPSLYSMQPTQSVAGDAEPHNA